MLQKGMKTSANLTGSAVNGVIAWGSGVGGLPRRIGVIRIPMSQTKDAPHLNVFRRSPILTLAGLGIDEVGRQVGAYLYGGVGGNFAGLWGAWLLIARGFCCYGMVC
jgi:hypothetical protein